MDCTLLTVVAVWSLPNPVTPIDDTGTPTITPTPGNYGYYCSNCGNGFGNWAACLGHILKTDVPNNGVDMATTQVQQLTQAASDAAASQDASVETPPTNDML